MFGWLGPQQAPGHARLLSRQQQVDSLRAANPFAVGVEQDPNSFDIGLRLPSGKIVRVRTTLPPGFPENGLPPMVRIVEAPTRHPWLDTQQRVAGSPELAAWAPSKNLGAVVLSIIQHFGSVPPVFEALGAGAQLLQPGPYSQQQPPQQRQQPGPYAQQPQQQQQHQQHQQQRQQQLPPQPGGAAAEGGRASSSSSSSTSGGGGGGGGRPPPPAAAPRGSSSGGSGGGGSGGGGGAATRRHTTTTALPPIPASFPELEALPLAELTRLLGDAAARAEWVAGQEAVCVFQAVAASSRDEAAGAARANLAAVAEAEQLAGELRALAARVAAGEAELRRLLGVRAAMRERLAPGRLSRDLAATAAELDAQSELLSEAFCDSHADGAGDGASVAGGSASGGWDDGRSVAGASAVTGGGGGGGVAAAVREFREDYLALRKRYHMANAKVEVLQQAGLA